MKIWDDKHENAKVWGTHYEIINFAAKVFNFTFETNVLDGPNYGELHPNGTWTGMYAMIYYRLGFSKSIFKSFNIFELIICDIAENKATTGVSCWVMTHLGLHTLITPLHLERLTWFLQPHGPSVNSNGQQFLNRYSYQFGFGQLFRTLSSPFSSSFSKESILL